MPDMRKQCVHFGVHKAHQHSNALIITIVEKCVIIFLNINYSNKKIVTLLINLIYYIENKYLCENCVVASAVYTYARKTFIHR